METVLAPVAETLRAVIVDESWWTGVWVPKAAVARESGLPDALSIDQASALTVQAATVQPPA